MRNGTDFIQEDSMFRFDKLTVKAQEAVEAAAAEARRRSHQQIDPEHLLFALPGAEEGVVSPLVSKLGGRINDLRTGAQSLLDGKPEVRGDNVQQFISQRLNGVFDGAAREADALKDSYVSTEHLLLALAADNDAKM